MKSRSISQAQRINNAGQLFSELIVKTCLVSKLNDANKILLRDQSLTALAEARASTHYADISEKLAAGQTVLDDELLYYVVAVDDVSKLDENVFARLKTLAKEYEFNSWWKSTIAVLMCAHEWQIEQDPVIKAQRNDDLYHALRARGSYRKYNVGFYLNMRGFNFTDADLTSTTLDCIDLEEANFSGTTLHNASIALSNISGANFNMTTAIRETNLKNQDQRVFSINGSIAKNASFCDVDYSEPFFTDSDLSGSSFKNSKIVSATINGSNLDNSDFSHGMLSTTCSYTSNAFTMKNANLVDADLSHLALSDIDMTGAKFLANDTFASVDNLNAALDKAQQTLKKLTEGGSDSHTEYQNEHLTKTIAENVVAGISELSNDNPLKQELLDAAVAHPIFQPQSATSQFIHSLSSGLYAAQCTLFGKANQKHIYHPTAALQILEEASERITPTIQHL